MQLVRFCTAALLLGMPGVASADLFGYTADDGTVTLTDIPSDPRYKLLLRTPDADASRRSSKKDVGAAEVGAAQLAALPYHAEVMSAALTHDVDAALIHAVIKAESAYSPRAVSHKGAVGLMQLMPATVRRYGVDNAADPRQNIVGGVRYLKDLIRLFNGDLTLVVAAYNAGENAVIRYGNRIPPYAETELYVPRVLSWYRRLTAGTPARVGSQRAVAAERTGKRRS